MADDKKNKGADIDNASAMEDEYGFNTAQETSESPVRAILQVLIGAIVFGGLAGAYLWNANRTHAADILIAEAKPLAELADVYSLTEARKKYMEAHDTKPSDKTVAGLAEINTLLWLLHGLEDYQQDAKDYVDTANADNVERAERYAYSALVASHEGDHAKAISQIKSALDRGAVSNRLSWVLGRAQRATGKLEEGRKNLKRAQDSSSAPHYGVDLGDAYEEDNEAYNARTYWAKAHKDNSAYVPAAARHVIGRSRTGEPTNTLHDELKRLDELNPELLGKLDKAFIEDARAEVFYREGNIKEAIAALKKGEELGGKTPRRDFQMARALMADGKTKEALDLYAAVQKQVPKSLHYLYGTAKALSKAGKHDDALNLLKSTELKESLAEKAGYHTAMADILHAKGDFAEAEKVYQEALKINERYPNALLGLGVNEWRKGQGEKAAEWFEKAMSARSKFPEVNEALGLMLLSLGDASNGNAQLEQAEKGLVARGTDASRMRDFYGTVIKTMVSKGGKSYVSAWVEREKKFREGS